MLNITKGTWKAISCFIENSPNVWRVAVNKWGGETIAECGTNGEANARAIASIPEFVALTEHVLAMANDAYLDGHPEWQEIVKDAQKAMSKAGAMC